MCTGTCISYNLWLQYCTQIFIYFFIVCVAYSKWSFAVDEFNRIFHQHTFHRICMPTNILYCTSMNGESMKRALLPIEKSFSSQHIRCHYMPFYAVFLLLSRSGHIQLNFNKKNKKSAVFLPAIFFLPDSSCFLPVPPTTPLDGRSGERRREHRRVQDWRGRIVSARDIKKLCFPGTYLIFNISRSLLAAHGDRRRPFFAATTE